MSNKTPIEFLISDLLIRIIIDVYSDSVDASINPPHFLFQKQFVRLRSFMVPLNNICSTNVKYQNFCVFISGTNFCE
ncbi:MAG: hypothetical protein CM1200mP38_8080 [Dehalococcoidia bacterium]|nr:MAG: hypothetical protein CM1200mP38_8080 [Dehalococcoidia bacterium]